MFTSVHENQPLRTLFKNIHSSDNTFEFHLLGLIKYSFRTPGNT